MKTIFLSIATFLIAGAISGGFFEANRLQRMHGQGFVLALSDFSFEIIYAAVFGTIGCLVGLLVGLMLFWLTKRAETTTDRH